MAAPYTYPTAEMTQGYIQATRSLAGQATQANTGSYLGSSAGVAPVSLRAVMANWAKRAAIYIAGADAAQVLFPPQQPLQPIAQPFDYSAVGRPWDYPVGWNTRVTPRTGEFISFRTLKALGNYDVLRLLIERVKEKIVAQDWDIMPRDKKAKRDKRCDEVAQFLQRPDGEHSFGDWAKMLLEQAIVYDAPSVWIVPSRGDTPNALRIIDGSMVSPKIMANGMTPPPEFGPAYQQVIKGLPAVDYIKPVQRGQPVPIDPSSDIDAPFPELLYKPRNPRVDSLYGFGPVEQMVTTVNIAIKREEYLLNYYTEGSTPDLIFTVPSTWNPDQIAKFKVWWDAVLKGNLNERRGTMFVPDQVKPFDTREKALTDQTDEWLIRILCFAMGINPMPFVKQMNRGQEKTHQEEAASEGLEPWNRWLSDFLNVIISVKFGYPDLCHRWEEQVATDPLEQAQIDQILINAKIYHPDERRAARGDDPMTPAMREQMDMATFSQSANATVLPPDQQAANTEARGAANPNAPPLGKARAATRRQIPGALRY